MDLTLTGHRPYSLPLLITFFLLSVTHFPISDTFWVLYDIFSSTVGVHSPSQQVHTAGSFPGPWLLLTYFSFYMWVLTLCSLVTHFFFIWGSWLTWLLLVTTNQRLEVTTIQCPLVTNQYFFCWPNTYNCTSRTHTHFFLYLRAMTLTCDDQSVSLVTHQYFLCWHNSTLNKYRCIILLTSVIEKYLSNHCLRLFFSIILIPPF